MQNLLQQAFSSYQQGNFEQALEFCKQAKSVNSKYYPVHNTFGMIYLAQNDFTSAVQSFKIALKLHKKDVVVWVNYGNALVKANKQGHAQKAFEEALKLEPDNYAILNNLSDVLIYLNKLDKVEIYLEKAIVIDNSQLAAFHNLGLFYERKQKFYKAIEAYDLALTKNSNSIITWLHKSDTHIILEQYDKAIQALEKIIEINPEFTDPYQKLGSTYIKTGDISKADTYIRKAISMQPDVYAFLNLAYLNTLSLDDPIFSMMLEKYNNSSDINDKKVLGFAIAYILDKHEEYKKSFPYLVKANKLKRKEINYNGVKETKQFKSIINHYSAEYCQQNALPINTDHTHIFILGMPRSGSTLIEQIISGCSDVFGAGEIDNLEKSLTEVAPYYMKGKFTLKKEQLIDISNKYNEFLSNKSIDSTYVSNKHLENIKHIGLIKMIFPDAKIIHCIRNPMDMCFSIFMQNFHTSIPFSFDLNEIADYFLAYQDIMQHWNNIFGDDIYEISYEKLIENQEDETRKLLNYCELDFQKECLEFHKNKRAVKTASYTQVRNPIYKKSVERWKNYEEELKPLADLIFP